MTLVIKPTPFNLLVDALDQDTHLCHVMIMHHSVAYCHVVLMCFVVIAVVGSAPEDNSEYPTEGQYQTTSQSGKQPPLSIPIQTHDLASALYTAFRQRFKCYFELR